MTTALTRLTLTLSLAIGLPPAAGAQAQDKMADKDMKMDHGEMMALAKGEFTGVGGHASSGSYQIVKEGGKLMLHTSADFAADEGAPDVYLVLSAGPKVGKDKAVWLGKLTKHMGKHSVEVPASAKLDQIDTVVLWCKKYSVTVGVAPLDGAALAKAAMHKMTPQGGR